MSSFRYNTVKYNDVANAPGIAVSIYLQGCRRACKNCFNPETWDYNGGQSLTINTIEEIRSKLNENGINRSLCILGGEPLSPENVEMTWTIINSLKPTLKNKVYIWTGYTIEQLEELARKDKEYNKFFQEIKRLTDYIIDGPYIEEQRDITLHMRGSRNQRIIDMSTYNN